MPIITLFEHQTRLYAELGWGLHHPALRSDWFELLTRLLAQNLHALMQQGMEHTYVGIEETIPLIRGRWQLARQLTRRPHVRHTFDVAYK